MIILDLDIPVDAEPIAYTEGAQPSKNLIDIFFRPVKDELNSKIKLDTKKYPHIDFELFQPFLKKLIDALNQDDIEEIRKVGFNHKAISKTDWEKNREIRALMVFLCFYPQYANLLQNIHLNASIVIKSTSFHFNKEISTDNFVEAKQFIDQMNRDRWTRRQTHSEEQSGKSNLGTVSEALLENALVSLIDNENFFKTNNNKIQSYGDFVLMCLPNNLWLSVKSNFARERLLASGYTTDILGVGFFTSADEFTSASKIRNLQRVGFLAMYLPEIPISEEQVLNGKNTYQQVMDHYRSEGRSEPFNINGTEFIRPLSQLHKDLYDILKVTKIANRTTIEF
jgi:hypothetical protein